MNDNIFMGSCIDCRINCLYKTFSKFGLKAERKRRFQGPEKGEIGEVFFPKFHREMERKGIIWGKEFPTFS